MAWRSSVRGLVPDRYADIISKPGLDAKMANLVALLCSQTQ